MSWGVLTGGRLVYTCVIVTNNTQVCLFIFLCNVRMIITKLQYIMEMSACIILDINSCDFMIHLSVVRSCSVLCPQPRHLSFRAYENKEKLNLKLI